MAYYEGEISPMGCYGNNNGGMFGNDGVWAILLLALLGGYGFGGRGGFGGGFGGVGYGVGNEFVGYELGKVATQADIASGFNNSAVLGSLNDLKLGQSTGFAGVQQTLCQGFNGINTAILQTQNSIDNSVCTLGYNMATGFNGISREIADCCCSTKGAIADLKYANEKQTCDIISAINSANQRLVDIYTNDKIDTLNRKLAVAEGQLSQFAQTNAIVSALKQPCPIPAYQVPNPNCCYNSCSGCSNF